MATILIVDDNSANRAFLISLLGYQGHELIEAADGAEGLERAREGRPDLVITDILMPRLDGYGFVYQLRADPSIAHTPVIFSTAAYHEREVGQIAAACGVAHVITMPSDPAAVLDAVGAALGDPSVSVPPQLSAEAFDRTHLRLVTDKLAEQSGALRVASTRLASLIELGQRLAVEHDPLRLLDQYCQTACEILCARYAVMYALDHEGRAPLQCISSALDPALAQRVHGARLHSGLLATLLAVRRPIRLYGLKLDPRAIGFPPDYPPLRSLLSVPLVSPARAYGVLFLADKLSADQFAPDDEQFAIMLAGQAAVAYENACRYDEIRRYATALEQEVAERKRIEVQFLHAQKMESVGRLAGGVAHDFNNLLTAITGYVDLALEDLPLHIEVRSNLIEIQKATRRAADLTRQLLAFARKQIVDPQSLNVNALILDTEKLLHRLIGEDVELRTLLAADVGHIYADPGQIGQVLINLAVNARDAMPDGGRLTIETSNVTLDDDYARRHVGVAPGPYVLLAVSDTGVGIAEELQEHLFEPFFTTKEGGRGTGLGLATCYGIVKQQGGNIWIYSEVGHGTTVKVYLPRVDAPPVVPPAPPRAAESPRGTETVLLAEDDTAVRALAAQVLRSQGYTVIEAAHGAEALAIALSGGAGKIDLLVTDVVMPQLGGKPLAEQMIASYPQLKILFVSGYTYNAFAPPGEFAPEVAFLQKPFAPAALVRKVREVLDGVEYRT